MRKQILSVIFLILAVGMSGVIRRVALDGSQDYTSIQAAIDASAHSDTVLVYPGRYYENLIFGGRNITLASLELTTGDIDYKYTTIIDGNQNGSVIMIRNGESNVVIRGFTITNGSGYYASIYNTTVGGGINIVGLTNPRQVYIVNSLFHGNNADFGGGLSASACNLYLSGTTIRDNQASYGGGIRYQDSGNNPWQMHFDPVNRCNIYRNYAASGADINTYWVNHTHVVVDTFTVMNPWNFYANGIPYIPSNDIPFTFDILNSIHEEVNHDLYVAPWGDDGNSGLSPADPLKTIYQAVYRIASDPDDPKTIHLADGLYSTSLNDQILPISIKDHTRVVGQSIEHTVIDCEGQIFCASPAYGRDLILRHFSTRNSTLLFYTTSPEIVLLQDINARYMPYFEGIANMILFERSVGYIIDNVSFSDLSSHVLYLIYTSRFDGECSIRELKIKNVTAPDGLRLLDVNGNGIVTLDRCSFTGNNSPSGDQFTSNMMFQISPSQSAQRLRVEISNSLFAGNHQGRFDHMAHVRALNDTVFISNCTFADNTGGSYPLAVSGTSVLTNNIFYNPALTAEVLIPNLNSSGIISRAEFNYNNIRNGISGVVNPSFINQMLWGTGNSSEEPLFAGDGDHPYLLSALSPLIDAGDPGFGTEHLGDWDLGHNERFWDGDGDGIARVDIGAYEYQEMPVPVNLTAEMLERIILLQWEMPVMGRGLNGYRVYRNGALLTGIADAALMEHYDLRAPVGTNVYQVTAVYGIVETAGSNPATVEVTPVADETQVPPLYALSISPNPFREVAVIQYHLSRQSRVRLEIYNLRGQRVRTLSDQIQPAGEYAFAWDGADPEGWNLASGIYLLRLQVEGRKPVVRKITLLR
ncbi:MAG: T9SS type A sorting domain-containing protein [Candidatus Cloacimonetes bacterium]|nr:T9SS type A sorting domain-containing protein [Candidatus Cloacimonadota bacterium]